MSTGAAARLVAFSALGKSLQMDLVETHRERRLRQLLQLRAYVLVSSACVLTTEGFAMGIKPIAKLPFSSSSGAQALFLMAG
jgi:hypothetical protein